MASPGLLLEYSWLLPEYMLMCFYCVHLFIHKNKQKKKTRKKTLRIPHVTTCPGSLLDLVLTVYDTGLCVTLQCSLWKWNICKVILITNMHLIFNYVVELLLLHWYYYYNIMNYINMCYCICNKDTEMSLKCSVLFTLTTCKIGKMISLCAV